jgi:hypothetical protein
MLRSILRRSEDSAASNILTPDFQPQSNL